MEKHHKSDPENYSFKVVLEVFMAAHITDKQRQECIRLRLEEDLPTIQISRKTGVSETTIFKILKPYPRVYRYVTWSVKKDRLLIEHFPNKERSELEAMFPGHTWSGITHRASDVLKLHRLPESLRKPKYKPHPLMARLRNIRRGRKITREDLSKKTGYHVNQILAWELGKVQPRLIHVEDVATALDYVLEINPKQETIDE